MKLNIAQELLIATKEMRGLVADAHVNNMDSVTDSVANTLLRDHQTVMVDLEAHNAIFEELMDDCVQNLFEDSEHLITAASMILNGEDSEDITSYIYGLHTMDHFTWNPVLPFEHTFLFLGNKSDFIQREYEKHHTFAVMAGYLVSKTDAFGLMHKISHDITTGRDEMILGSTVFPLVKQGVPVISGSENRHNTICLRTLAILLQRIKDKGLHWAGPSYTQKANKLRKAGADIPSALRIVTMRPYEYRVDDYLEQERCASTQRNAHIVAEHDATWILRGELPMGDKTANYLSKDARRVIITDASQITPEIAKIFEARGIVYEANEWISVLTVRRKQHTRGQGDMPESIHVANKLVEN